MRYYVLGLGSNLSNPLIQLKKAIQNLKENSIKICDYSSIYISEAVVPDNAPLSWKLPFLNAAILVYTNDDPDQLLQKIKKIEVDMGRAADHAFWSPRVIDIDILCSDYLCVAKPELTIPHKELLNRSFALQPLLDVLPEWTHPKFLELDLKAHCQTLAPVKTIKQLLFGPELMGILNLTPDSFSDGGKYNSLDGAISHFNQLIEEGAYSIDIGAVSTSLKALQQPITAPEEWQRLEPMLEYLKDHYSQLEIKPIISIDTYHTETIEKLVSSYAFITRINDTMGSHIEQKAEILSTNPQIEYVIMDNWRGPYASIGESLSDDYDRVIAFFDYQIEKLLLRGVNRSQLICDPGFGFAKPSKTVRYLTDRIKTMKKYLNMPILIGHSRKQSILNPLNKIIKHNNFDLLDLETSILSFHLINMGADILRVHQVDFCRKASILSNFYHD